MKLWERRTKGRNQLPLSTVQYLTFLTAGEEYAIAIVKVREIIEYEAVTTVPNTPVWIRGVTNLRGRVVPVVDLAVKFGIARQRHFQVLLHHHHGSDVPGREPDHGGFGRLREPGH